MSFAAYYVPGGILGFEDEAVSIFDIQTDKK